MNDITNISKTFFGICVGAFIGLAVYLIVNFVVFEPPLFFPPPETEERSLEEAINESTDIDGLRRICSVFARCEDRLNAFEDYHFNQMDYFVKHFFVALFAIIALFGFGFWRIWRLSKQTNEINTNAL
ncbi:hypothetical protein [Neptunomonas sp.]|uniref:hypothetical protein n=1 Tax=Neptunomonas sp. TaxID=1971898 RepID=UPI0035636930